jgi:hypothetical protein
MSDDIDDLLQHPVFKPHWPEGLEPSTCYEIECDDDGQLLDATMRVMVSEDGDVWVNMSKKRDEEGNLLDHMPGIRVRTLHGGGRNMRTRQALLWLALAIKLDTEGDREPQGIIKAKG